jgi:sensor histidine kinase YesM
VTVLARRDSTDGDGGFLRLLVIDTGRGFGRSNGEQREGVGLSNIENRLRHYYGAEAAIVVRETPGGGATVELCVPLATAAPAPVAVG